MKPFRPPLDPVAYYDQLATDFASRYDTVTFEAVHPNLSKHLPRHGRVLDIGSGSGRDARGLAARGLHVIAVEPSAVFRRLGGPSSDGIIWIDDRLPMLALLDGIVEPFDFILCSAVLMLLSTSDLGSSFRTMARLLAEHGRLAVNIRDPMPGEPTAIFHLHTDAAILEAANVAGLACIDRAELNDALGRPSYLWRSYVFSH
ncbi:class I SAM-dependent methyltransferase [Rhizobium leguminosarum]|uniref:class I SAM-dependent methyltransferase n=1 Tax=Rhizobium leguminosarum TaxID=384 RepID=UPI001039E3DF|nr:class I SAM-dependent methyltransferase [Rhizobium leguminosarum]TBY46641.1 class I SAM-dependent methyltransferase [Rhizobium leguminosarum bv. viciae]